MDSELKKELQELFLTLNLIFMELQEIKDVLKARPDEKDVLYENVNHYHDRLKILDAKRRQLFKSVTE